MEITDSPLPFIVNFVRAQIDHFYRPALPVVAIIFVVLIVFSFASSALTVFFLFVLGGAVVFYNNPPRLIPQGAGLVLSPIDGYVYSIQNDVGLPLTFDQAKDQVEHFSRITFYASIRGSRVIRMPVTGTIREILRFTPDEQKGDNNWSCMDGAAILVADASGVEYALVINAPLAPKQLRMQVQVGDAVNAGSPIGIALFFAWAELYIPKGAPLLKTVTHQVVAGETVLQTPAWQQVPGFEKV